MNRKSALLLLTLAVSTFACVARREPYAALPSRSLQPEMSQTLLLQVDYGEVNVRSSPDSQIHVDGQTLFLDELEYQVDSMEEQILIRIFAHHRDANQAPLVVTVLLPAGMHARVETKDASIRAQEIQMDLEITSISGDISIERVNGLVSLHSNRGNINVQDSSGVVSIVGNYGALTAQDVRGDVALSTIMGDILFRGLIQQGDNIRLETDHGSVAVDVKAGSDLSLQVDSTSGDVACMLPDIVSSTRTCDGKVASGNGTLSVRTVSGAVKLQSIP